MSGVLIQYRRVKRSKPPRKQSRWELLKKGFEKACEWVSEIVFPMENPFDRAWDEVMNGLIFEGAYE